MSQVKVKYTLTADATVNVDELKFGSKDASVIKKDGTEAFPDATVVADDKISIKLLMSGASGKWVLTVFVSELNEAGNANGTWIPCANNGTDAFKGNIDTKNNYNDLSTITWP